MAERNHNNDPSLAREKLIELLEDDQYRFTEKARNEGQVALKNYFGSTPSEIMIIDYIIDLLRNNIPLYHTPMGEPPGSNGTGWVMNNPDGFHTYIKLKIQENGIRDMAWVISCHTSKHKPKSSGESS